MRIYITDAITNERIYQLDTDYALIPNVNDTISLCSIGDFVVARREFGYAYNGDYYGSQELSYIDLKVYLKPQNKEEI